MIRASKSGRRAPRSASGAARPGELRETVQSIALALLVRPGHQDPGLPAVHHPLGVRKSPICTRATVSWSPSGPTATATTRSCSAHAAVSRAACCSTRPGGRRHRLQAARAAVTWTTSSASSACPATACGSAADASISTGEPSRSRPTRPSSAVDDPPRPRGGPPGGGRPIRTAGGI